VSQVHDGYIACGFSFPHVLAHFLKPLFHTYVDEEEREGGREMKEKERRGGCFWLNILRKGEKRARGGVFVKEWNRC
jgi:hypothetical protein